jgi:heme oxygenase
LGDSVALPVGWKDLDTSFNAWVLRAFGWLFVATAVTLGAPFWFDLLGRALARKRGTSSH